jgi:thiamine-phosphate pyrophosphorylase
MNLEYSPAFVLACQRAALFAAGEAAPKVEPRHLLRGLLAEEEGRGVALLIQAGVDWPGLQVHLALPAALEPVDAPSIPLHPASQNVLHDASALARSHADEGSVTSDHLLRALLNASSSLREELERFGLDFARLNTSVVGETAPVPMPEPLLLDEPIEQVQVSRLLDANANRAREALRVLEDYTRFILNDAFLSRELKELRHALTQALGLLPARLLLESRDTPGDVGTAISTEQEWQRPTLHAVLQANAKRLQEALRCLEEYGKMVETAFAEQIEKIRYESYTLERALMKTARAAERLANVQLYVLVTDALCRCSLAGTVREAALGGAQMIQLREKDLDDRTLLARARDLRQLTQSAGVLFIVNDRPDIALLAQADGVHLGQDDLPVRAARSVLGPDALIGVSTHTLEQVRQAVLDGADYIGVGPTFPSATKQFDQLAGLEFVRQALAETSLPAFAIGGIQPDNIAELRAAGARRIAVSHAVCAAADPRAAAQLLRQALSQV